MLSSESLKMGLGICVVTHTVGAGMQKIYTVFFIRQNASL